MDVGPGVVRVGGPGSASHRPEEGGGQLGRELAIGAPKLDLPGIPAKDDLVSCSTHVRLDRSAPMNVKRLRFLARRHRADLSFAPCRTDGIEPCDAALLAAEVARQRAWVDFASDLLDAHIWGFGAGDWQASEALAHALEGEDYPPAWQQDPDDPAHIVVGHALWPVHRARPSRLIRTHVDEY
jgi:hypothetical protein